MTHDGFSLHASAHHFSTLEFMSHTSCMICYLCIERGTGYLFHYLQRVLNSKLKGNFFLFLFYFLASCER